MPKRFLYFLIVAQTILILGHLLLYQSLLFFFPAVKSHHTLILWLLVFLSFSFLLFSILSYKIENFIFRVGYIVSACWVLTWFYLLLASAISLVVYIFASTGARAIISVIFFFPVLLSLYGIINARITRTITITVRLPNLPQFWKNKTAVMVSDLHLGQVLRTGFAQKVINKINNLNPEIVFIPGDFFDGAHADFVVLAKKFKQIKAPLGIYFCSGNHEQFAGYQECEEALRKAGIKILENEKVEIQGLQIAGAAYTSENMSNFKETLNSFSLDRQKPSILLKHVPLQLKEAADAGFSLQLSGHTHQGQVWPGRYQTKVYFKGYDYGLKKIDAMQIYISSGVGTWGPPMRVFTKSEIIQIKFE